MLKHCSKVLCEREFFLKLKKCDPLANFDNPSPQLRPDNYTFQCVMCSRVCYEEQNTLTYNNTTMPGSKFAFESSIHRSGFESRERLISHHSGQLPPGSWDYWRSAHWRLETTQFAPSLTFVLHEAGQSAFLHTHAVVFINESWSYLIYQHFLALIAFLCWCAVKQSIDQSSLTWCSQLGLLPDKRV